MTLERRNHGRGHSYYIDGEKVPGITTVLDSGVPKPALVRWAAGCAADYAVDHWQDLEALKPSERQALIRKAPDAERSSAAVRGTRIHELAQRLAAGDEVEVSDEARGFVDAYLAFADAWTPDEVLVERPFFHRKLRYAGTPDLVADLADGQRWLLDWKTGASGIWPEHALQLAAARFCEVYVTADGAEASVGALRIQACAAVHLRGDGSFDLRPVEAGPAAWRAFLHAKEVAAYRSTDRDEWIGDALEAPLAKGA